MHAYTHQLTQTPRFGFLWRHPKTLTELLRWLVLLTSVKAAHAQVIWSHHTAHQITDHISFQLYKIRIVPASEHWNKKKWQAEKYQNSSKVKKNNWKLHKSNRFDIYFVLRLFACIFYISQSMYSLPVAIFILAVGLAYALPPFEIRSAGPKSEAALEWLQHLSHSSHRQKGKCNVHFVAFHPSLFIVTRAWICVLKPGAFH